MKICVIGNCQIAALRPLLRALSGELEHDSLPAVHTMTARHEALIEEETKSADWIIGQYITDDWPLASVRTSTLRSRFGPKLIVWPNLYFMGYAPEFNTLRDVRLSHYPGPLLGYHSDKILYGFAKGLTVQETVEIISRPTSLDEKLYSGAVQNSLNALKAREALTDVAISDFIEAEFPKRRLFYIMNHPSIDAVKELACRLLSMMEIRYSKNVSSDLFKDYELVSAMHPENPFIRELHGLSFPAIEHYRGVRIVPAANEIGFVQAGPMIYDHMGIVEEMFRFYSPHREALLTHNRIINLIKRA